jgi:hypothetical protein
MAGVVLVGGALMFDSKCGMGFGFDLQLRDCSFAVNLFGLLCGRFYEDWSRCGGDGEVFICFASGVC